MQKTDKDWEIFREGERANDHNKKVFRQKKGECFWNPYDGGTRQHAMWQEGYGYRDMVNDG